VKKFFFHMMVNDVSKMYAPQYQTIIDIPTALELFGRNPQETRARVCSKVHKLVEAWNTRFIHNGGDKGGKKKVSQKFV
jgi:hypothetical protein